MSERSVQRPQTQTSPPRYKSCSLARRGTPLYPPTAAAMTESTICVCVCVCVCSRTREQVSECFDAKRRLEELQSFDRCVAPHVIGSSVMA
eukprot:COSAG05_NODE_1513_length_4667_cov_51.337785_1_plen_91_part_00